jgi:type II secretory pathway component PulF
VPVFTYTALNRDTRKVSGEVEARSRAEACQILERQELQPVRLALKDAPAAGEVASDPGSLRMNASQIIQFSEELSDLLDAGLQLESALRIIEERQEGSSIKRVASVLRQKVREGSSFSNALRTTCPSFGELYCSLMAAGELSGSLPRIIRRQCAYLKAMQELKRKITQSLIYPAFLVGSGVLLLGIFMTFLVPQMTSLFAKSSNEMPLVTKLLIGFSSFLGSYGIYVAVLLVLAVAGFVFYIRRPDGKRWWDEAHLRLPMVGLVFQSQYFAQLFYTLSNMVGNGIPLLNGLQLMVRATQNLFYRSALERITADVAEGRSLSRSMRSAGVFPPTVIDLIGVGEQTGNLSAALANLADRSEREMNRRIERIMSLVPPLIIITIALVAGVVVYSIISSIFDVIGSLKMR